MEEATGRGHKRKVCKTVLSRQRDVAKIMDYRAIKRLFKISKLPLSLHALNYEYEITVKISKCGTFEFNTDVQMIRITKISLLTKNS